MPLNEIISAIAGFASPILKDKIQRNETVIKLLQQFKLDPEHPPSNCLGLPTVRSLIFIVEEELMP
jgi:hypothetical protein